MTRDRKHFEAPVDRQESLFKKSLSHRQVLGELRDEWTYRKNRHTKQLLKEIEGVLAGEVVRQLVTKGSGAAESRTLAYTRQICATVPVASA